MNRLPCGVVKDLLPLYIDELCGQETNTLVAEHLDHCPDCRSRYEAMRAPVEVETADLPQTEPGEEKARTILRKAARRCIIAAAGLVILAILLAAPLSAGLVWISEEPNIPAKEIELLEAKVAGDGFLSLRLGAATRHPVSNGGILERTDEDGQVYYIVFFWCHRYDRFLPRPDDGKYACILDSRTELPHLRIEPDAKIYASGGGERILLWDGTENGVTEP